MNILVPMDFTEVSLNGFSYAFNKFKNANITVLHVISGVLNIKGPFIAQPNMTQDMIAESRLRESIIEQLNQKELPENVTIRAHYGEPVNVITKYLSDHSFDAVVIGSRDKYDLFDKIFGTICLGVVKKAKEPIFVVPRYAQYRENQKVLMACDESISNPDMLNAINYWNHTDAHIKFLHVTNDEDDNFESTKESLIKNLYEDFQPSFSYEIEEVRSSRVSESILSSAYSFGADLLMVIARPSSFLKSLVFSSTSKDLILKSSIPILFLHGENQLNQS